MTTEELQQLGIEKICTEKKDGIECNENVLVFVDDKTSFVADKLEYLIENKRLSRIKKVAVVREVDQQKEITNEKCVVNTLPSFLISEIIPFFDSYRGIPHRHSTFMNVRAIQKPTREELVAMMEKHCVVGMYEDESKNFLSEIALDILKGSKVAREYIMYTYDWLFIDENCDRDTLQLLGYLSDELGVKLCFVSNGKGVE